MSFYVVYHENGNVDVKKSKGRTFLELAEAEGYSLLHLAYFEEVQDRNTRNFEWDGKSWIRK